MNLHKFKIFRPLTPLNDLPNSLFKRRLCLPPELPLLPAPQVFQIARVVPLRRVQDPVCRVRDLEELPRQLALAPRSDLRRVPVLFRAHV